MYIMSREVIESITTAPKPDRDTSDSEEEFRGRTRNRILLLNDATEKIEEETYGEIPTAEAAAVAVGAQDDTTMGGIHHHYPAYIPSRVAGDMEFLWDETVSCKSESASKKEIREGMDECTRGELDEEENRGKIPTATEAVVDETGALKGAAVVDAGTSMGPAMVHAGPSMQVEGSIYEAGDEMEPKKVKKRVKKKMPKKKTGHTKRVELLRSTSRDLKKAENISSTESSLSSLISVEAIYGSFPEPVQSRNPGELIIEQWIPEKSSSSSEYLSAVDFMLRDEEIDAWRLECARYARLPRKRRALKRSQKKNRVRKRRALKKREKKRRLKTRAHKRRGNKKRALKRREKKKRQKRRAQKRR